MHATQQVSRATRNKEKQKINGVGVSVSVVFALATGSSSISGVGSAKQRVFKPVLLL